MVSRRDSQTKEYVKGDIGSTLMASSICPLNTTGASPHIDAYRRTEEREKERGRREREGGRKEESWINQIVNNWYFVQ